MAEYAELREIIKEVKTDISDFRKEIKTDISDFRKEVKTDISDFRKEVKTDINNLGNKVDNVTSRVDALYGGLSLAKWVFGGIAIPVIAIALKLWLS